ncbi:tryptophan dimethylallyltransferase-domain-containing protein [Aspergillus tamarii]|uniref:Tryptophan dimethylallyltransferase-domain-containing protein n=1 Tax=Aspergillus tamarii TaxID=41984 RepID=A0A5N6V544_ASPTM|nr:tryptophan dimethylallyltransferase-domain-containing protein [Aspergillus tamarii]
MPKSMESPWHILNRSWWEKIGPIIAAHLEGVNYSAGAQYKHLLMLHSATLPRSCFRLAVEPVGPDAGTEPDPINEHVARQLLEDLSQIQSGIDFTLFNHLDNIVALSNHEARHHWDRIKQFPSKFQKLIALDLREISLTAKPYLVPLIKSIATGVDPLRIMIESIKSFSFWQESPLTFGLSKIDDFIAETKHCLLDPKSFLAIDSKEPGQSRVKIYAGTNVTTLTEVYDFWTLGGRLQNEDVEKGFAIVQKIWKAIFSMPLPNRMAREYLTFTWNWELSPTNPKPAPKAYFLISEDHDKLVTEALISLFEELCWSDHIATHRRIQELAYPTYDFETCTQVYTWIAVASSKRQGPTLQYTVILLHSVYRERGETF